MINMKPRAFPLLFLLPFLLVLAGCAPSGSYRTLNTPPSVMPQLMPKADYVLVEKSKSKMYLLHQGRVLRSYNIALGGNPVGHKQERGDLRTPEGIYTLDYKNMRSKFYRSINIDYPNERDIARAAARGVDPGDDIVIHGFPNHLAHVRGNITPKNWTEGCIAVRNHEMDEIWSHVDVGTPIEIRP